MKNKFYFLLFFIFFLPAYLFGTEIVINQEDWPCKLIHLEKPNTTYYWPDKEIKMTSDWEKNEDVKELVNYITNHANSIDQGTLALNNFIKKMKKENKQEIFDLIFSGIYQEMTLYLKLARHGVFQFITRIKLTEAELIKEKSNGQKFVKRNIGRSKRGWILEIADDSEEEAEFQCQRMDFLDKKAKSLTKVLINNL